MRVGHTKGLIWCLMGGEPRRAKMCSPLNGHHVLELGAEAVSCTNLQQQLEAAKPIYRHVNPLLFKAGGKRWICRT
jgi:hypothetical protein